MSYAFSVAEYVPRGESESAKNGGWHNNNKPPPPPPKHFRAEDEPLDEMHRRYEMQSPRGYSPSGSPRGPSVMPPPPDEDGNEQMLWTRVKQLQDERVGIQKKTFTKWCNSFLNRARLEIVDLFADVGDGVLLMKLLEIISGEKLGKPNRGRMRVQKIENLNKVLDFLKRKKIQLENIGAEDILDRNERLILGLIWTIILRFQIDTIVIDVGEEETGERKHAKDALLLWCQRKTVGYSHVKIDNFTNSWRSGLAFNALIHAHRPDLISYDRLNPQDHIANLNNAFDVAEKKLDIARLLDAEDVDTKTPDEKSIITYVSLYYHYFAKQKTELTGARRVANIVGKIMSSDATEDDYEAISSDLLNWIRETIKVLNGRQFPNSLKGIQEHLVLFNQFRTVEKPPKYKEKGELEALFFTVQTKRKAMGRKAYVPPQGLFMHDIETAWSALDKAENDRQAALISEMLRQQRLERLAERFYRKAQLRDAWLRDMSRILEQLESPSTATEVEASLKKQQAISADILPREDRFKVISEMCVDLCRENYHESDRVRGREREIIERWTQLLSLLDKKRKALEGLNELMTLLRDLDTLSADLRQLEPQVRNRDVGKHILGVDDLLGKHEFLESQIHGHGVWLQKMSRQAAAYMRVKGDQAEVLQRKLEAVTAQYESLIELSHQRRAALQKARELFQFIQDDEEERAWLREKEQVCQRALESSDISMVPQYNRLHKNVETEMQSHWTRTKEMMASGEGLIQAGHPKEDIQRRTTAIQHAWDALRKIVKALGQWLVDAQHAQQYFQDANEAESWIREKMPLVKSDDLGRDEGAAESLLQRHIRLEEEIHAYRADIARLDELANQLASSHFHTQASTSVVEETDEMVVPTVRMLYKFKSDTFSLAKDEVLALLEKSTADWWRVVRQDGIEGYVPANYVKEEDGTITVTTTTTKTKSASTEGKQAIVQRQQAISADYRILIRLADDRRRLLSDNIKLMRFYRECDEFEVWAKDTETALIDEPTVEHVHAFRKKFEKLENDIKTNGGTQLKRINGMAEELTTEGHSQARQIEARQRAVNAAWNHLEKLRAAKAARLATAERMADFDVSCEDVHAWMRGKFQLIEQHPDDLKSLQNLERDLKPLEDRMRELEKIAGEVKKAHPDQAAAIERKMGELKRIHGELIRMAHERIQLAEQSQGQEMYENALRDIHMWIEKTKKELAEEGRPVDVAQAEELLKKHFELGEVIKDKKYEVEYVNELARRLLEKNPRLTSVKDSLAHLAKEMTVIREMWKERDIALKQQLDLQLFNREAERIDAATKGHEAFLDYADLGDSVESVENLLKRHKDLEAKLEAQESRLSAFSSNADDLIKNRHVDSRYIGERRSEVLARRAAVRRSAADRRRRLEASLEYQNMRRDAHEMLVWINEKKKLASDEAHRDLATIDVKLLKHEAFEAEIRANSPRVEHINKEGAGLVSIKHYESKNVTHLVETVNTEWAELRDAANRKGERLRQAADQKGLNRVLEDAHTKLDELEAALRSKEMGADLRGVKELIQKHNVFEQDMIFYEKKLNDIASRGHKMAEQGHFDGDRIQRTVRQLLKRFGELKGPCADRRAALNESMQWHQLAFDVDCELQWINEKLPFSMPIAASQETGRTLTEALNMLKKQEQLDAELQQHAPSVEGTIGRGNELIKRRHPAEHHIRQKCDQLSNAWVELSRLIKARKQIVSWGVKEQTYLSDAAEVESWMNEKRSALESSEYGNDEDAAQKLLAKHKALQNDMSTYKQWLDNLAAKCAELVASKRPHVDRFERRQDELQQEFDRLSHLADERRRALEDAVCLYEYIRESHDIELWINEQLQTAMSEEYGEDYEHLKELQSRFDEFKQSVKTGSDRFRSCEAAANSILRRSPPFVTDVLKRQEKLRSVWTLLVDYIEGREQKLKAAEELHRFNRDVAEHEESINEMMNSIPDDLGRDVKQAHSLWQKHEAFEHQLLAKRHERQTIFEEAARLKGKYPGGNAEHIAAQEAAIAELWHDIEEAAGIRKDRLKEAYDLHRFIGDVRDILNWADMIIMDMQSEQHTHDLQGAEYLQKEHARLLSEIDSREPEFTNLITTGERMVQGEHYASKEIRSRCAQVKEHLSKLRSEWQLRSSYLTEVVQWHAFQREAKQILGVISSKRTALHKAAIGTSVEEIEGAKKRLAIFESSLSAVIDRIAELDKNADRLIVARHMERTNIEHLKKKVHDAFSVLESEVSARHLSLSDAFVLASLESDIAETDAWIEDRLKIIHTEAERQGQCTSIEDKMKRLQRYQAFEAEMEANRHRIGHILHTGRQLRGKHGTERVCDACVSLSSKWSSLESACSDQSRALEEARDLLAFKQLVDRVLQWIREKEMMVHAADMGKDLEHCKVLLDRLDGTKADNSVDEQTLEEINRLGEKLITQGRSSRKEVQDEQKLLNNKWQHLHGKVAEYRAHLSAALEVHAFNRDVDDTDERIHEKTIAMQSTDYGKDFHGVDALMRKQRALERDMGVIHQKLVLHDTEAQKILAKKPPLRETILDSLKKLEESWKKLADAAEHRNINLDKSFQLHKYLDSVRKAEQWSTSVRMKMCSYAEPKTSGEVRALIEQHNERKAEIDSRQEELKILHEEGNRLASDQAAHKGEVQRANKRLQNSEHQLRQTWESERASLGRKLEYLLFVEQTLHIEGWLASKEGFLSSSDLGDTPDAVQLLIKKHDAFEQTLHAQSDRLDTLKRDAVVLVSADRDHASAIEDKRDSILTRHANLLSSCERRRALLVDSHRFHEFIRSCSELITWINAKFQIAYDESYLDPTNLRSKLQKHLAFDSELSENEKRLHAVVRDGEELIRQKHYNSQQVEAQLKEVQGGWDELRQKSSLKAQRLREAYEAHLLQRKVEDIERWLDLKEAELSSEDHGRDLHTVENLMKKLDALDAEIKGRRDAVEETMKKARTLKTMGSSPSEALLLAAEQVEVRYKSLAEPVQIRRENLREAKRLFEWRAEAAEEAEWLADRLPMARSTDWGDSLHAAHSLSKKHATLEKELDSRQFALRECEARGLQMVREKHQASAQVQEMLDRLSSTLLQMKQAVVDRRRRLDEAVESHQYFAEVAEAEQWIKDKLPLAANQETGRDQAGAESQLRRLGVLDKDVNKFKEEVERLGRTAEALCEKEHHDAAQISARQARLSSSYSELVRECNRRRQLLIDASKYHDYVMRVDGLADWLHEKEQSAHSEDYGRDLEDCQQLSEAFEAVVRELAAYGERVAAVHRLHEELLRANHPYAASIRAKGTDLNRLWTSVNEAATERKLALAGAREVHKFDQDADETLNWLQEKEALEVALEKEEDLSHADLESVKRAMQRHDEFMHGMKAVEKQVRELCVEADRLESSFPSTRAHLEDRRIDMQEQLKDILQATALHYEKLRQTEHLQAYFQEHRELIVWCKRVQEQMVTERLPRDDVLAWEALTARHAETASEMRARKAHVEQFTNRGRDMIKSGHVLSSEIHDKVEGLERGYALLWALWADRNEWYEMALDAQKWKTNAATQERWLSERETLLGDDWKTVDGVESLEQYIRDYDDFLVTLDAQNEKFTLLERLTLIEQNISKLRQRENDRIRVDEEASKKKEHIKTVERDNLLYNRRKERERRKTQEISLLKPAPEEIVSQTLPRKMDRRERSKTTAFGGSPIPGSSVAKDPLITEAVANAAPLIGEGTLPRSTPGFTTRRSTSLRHSRGEDMSSIDMRGFVDRKHELQSGGRKATIRSWKNYYTILCGQLLCFFKDETAFDENTAASPPVNIYGAQCQPFPDYVKRKHAFKVCLSDGSEFLFACPEERQMLEWVAKIRFHAGLAPSMQLRSFSNSTASSNADPAGRPHSSSYESHSSSDGAPPPPPPVHRPPPSESSTPVAHPPSQVARRHSSLRKENPHTASSSLPTLYDSSVPMRAALSRRESRRNVRTSVYESVYEEELSTQGDAETASVSSRDHNGSVSYVNGNGHPPHTVTEARLEYHEHTSSRYVREQTSPSSSAGTPPDAAPTRTSTLPPRKNIPPKEDEFVAWVERYGTPVHPNAAHASNHSTSDDSDSVKSAKKKGFNFFKRSTKTTPSK